MLRPIHAAAYTALMIFSTSSFSPLKPGERDDQSFSASGTVLRPPGRQAATMQPCVKDGNVMFYDKISHTMFKPYPAIPAEGNVGKDGFAMILK